MLASGTKRKAASSLERQTNHVSREAGLAGSGVDESLPLLALGVQAKTISPDAAVTTNAAANYVFPQPFRNSLRDLQVQVLERKLAVLLPTLPLEQLSDDFVQKRLEMFMRKPSGKLFRFLDEINRIWQAYAENAAIASSKPSENNRESRPSANSSMALVEQNQHSELCNMGDLAKNKEQQKWPWERFCEEVESSPERDEVIITNIIPGAHAEDTFPDNVEPQSTLVSGDALQDTEEVDEWGFQIALDEMEAAPAEVVANVLQMLIDGRPTKDVLEDDLFMDALSSQLAEPAESLVGSLARKLCTVWKRYAGTSIQL